MGRRNWGYDGVLPFAPDTALRNAGRPRQRSSTAAHELGLGVLLDVVYNHFGPSGTHAPPCREALLHRAASDALGAGDRPRQCGRARLLRGECLPVGRRVRLRRPPPRRRACLRDRGRRPSARRDRRGRAGAEARRVARAGERHERRPLAGAGRRRPAAPLHRAVERRRPPRPPCRRDGREGRLLRGLRGRDPLPHGARVRRGLRLPGRAEPAPGRRAARRALGPSAARRLRGLHPEPRPDRQPPVRRPHRGPHRQGSPRLPHLRGHARPAGSALLHGRRIWR